MIYITGNRSNDATESQKEKKRPVFMLIFSAVSKKSHDFKSKA